MELYCTNNIKRDNGTARSKAPADCFLFAQKIGAQEIIFYESRRKFSNIYLNRLFAFFTGLDNWIRLLKSVSSGSYVILQHPDEGIILSNILINFCKKIKKIKFIALIHDLNSIRKSLINNSKMLEHRDIEADEVLLKKCDYLICHNEKMKNYLINKGFDSKKIITLEIFDYYSTTEIRSNRKNKKDLTVAGNLLKNKCAYLYKLIQNDNFNYKLHLYGPNYVGPENRENIVYHGQYGAEELLSVLEGSFGLVWDGTEINTCSGNAGEYLRYNNPHKCSLYLAAGLPVIIWKEAALAPFIERNHLGFCVNSLDEIDSVLDSISDEEYKIISQNCREIGEKIRSGYFLTKALRSILELENRETGD